MVPTCSDDPVACLDFVFLFIGEFLKDWTTLAMLALLLFLLLKQRADQRKAREQAYARQMASYEETRRQNQTQTGTWEVK